MPILGIDYDKCINCKLCAKVCLKRYIKDEEHDRVFFHAPMGTCNSCGHCIAVCPENAILYEGLKDEPYVFDGIETLENVASFETVYNLLRANRSVRYYKKDKVPDDVLKKVIDIMQYAPTGGNTRSERYAIISDEHKIKSLSDAVMVELMRDPVTKLRYQEFFNIQKKTFRSPVYFDAPHVIFVSSVFDTQIADQNIGIVITYGRLAAESLGLGTCWNGWTQIAVEINKKILRLIGTRGNRIGVFSIGFPKISYQRCPPRPHKLMKGLNLS